MTIVTGLVSLYSTVEVDSSSGIWYEPAVVRAWSSTDSSPAPLLVEATTSSLREGGLSREARGNQGERDNLLA